MYQARWLSESYEKLFYESENQIIRDYFSFLGSIYQELTEAHKFKYLPLLELEKPTTFEDVVRTLAGIRFNKGMIRKFGEETKKHGTVFLNNVYHLNLIYHDRPLNLDDVLNLDHSRILKKEMVRYGSAFIFIRDNYSLKRMFTLMTADKTTTIGQLEGMLHYNLRTDIELPLKESFPRRPKNFKEIHDVVSKKILDILYINKPLNQDIDFLHNLKLLGYEIEVPVWSDDLKETSRELKHCVYTYGNKVIQKKCQILNLKKDGKRFFTVELVPEGDTYKITEFKGLNNDSTMERNAGKKCRSHLLRMIEKKDIVII